MEGRDREHFGNQADRLVSAIGRNGAQGCAILAEVLYGDSEKAMDRNKEGVCGSPLDTEFNLAAGLYGDFDEDIAMNKEGVCCSPSVMEITLAAVLDGDSEDALS
jgi:hypothetical protein